MNIQWRLFAVCNQLASQNSEDLKFHLRFQSLYFLSHFQLEGFPETLRLLLVRSCIVSALNFCVDATIIVVYTCVSVNHNISGAFDSSREFRSENICLHK